MKLPSNAHQIYRGNPFECEGLENPISSKLQNHCKDKKD